MYTVTKMQDRAGHFETLDTCDTLEDAIASAKCEVDGHETGYTVYIFCDQVFIGKTSPYLVAKVTYYNPSTHNVVGGAVVAYAEPIAHH